jgi:FixJ family two-component response regulator
LSDAKGTVFVVDDDPSVRKAAARLFRSAEFDVETFESADEFLEFPRPDLPSCLVLDVRMPGLSGIELQQQLVARDGDLPIIFMTGHGDIPMSVQAMKAGAVDFLPKPVNDDQLLHVVQQAIDLHAQNRQQAAEVAEFRGRLQLLTAREREVMQSVVAGMLNKQIGKKMGITEATVKVHRGRVMEKLAVASVAELVRLNERAEMS